LRDSIDFMKVATGGSGGGQRGGMETVDIYTRYVHRLRRMLISVTKPCC
jgi:hypothetical protein